MDPKEEQILNKINSGELKMRPRIYFVLRGALAALAALLLLAVCAFVVSFLFYMARPSADSAADLRVFFSVFPWILIAIAVLMAIGLAFILKRYPFAYRKPLIFLPIGIIAAVTLITIVAQAFSLHERFERFSTGRRVPGFEKIYGERERLGHNHNHHGGNQVSPMQQPDQNGLQIMPMQQ